MNPDPIFELIRREEAVLWAGSGLSLYAGYPTGAALAKTIYDSLSAQEKMDVGANLALAELAEQFVRIRDNKRDDLISILRQIFTRKPCALHVHQTLAKIPHFRTIITTNYDRLFETAYGNQLWPIVRESDLGQAGNRIELFKVHGDIGQPDTMVITKSDYSDFDYQRLRDNLYWANLKARITDKAIVFIGYDLEDENIKNVLKQVVRALGPNRKEMFLIAPGFKKHKVNYLADLGIQYYDSKGQKFIDGLLGSLRNNIATDFDKGHVGPETVRKFFQDHGLSPQLDARKDGYFLKGVNPLTEKLKSQISFIPKENNEFLQSFKEIVSGRKFGEVIVDSHSVQDLKFLLNDLNIVSSASEFRFEFRSQPQRKGKVSITFDDGAEFDDVDYEFYLSKELAQVIVSYKKSKFIFEVILPVGAGDSDPIHLNLRFEPPERFDSVADAVATYRLGLKLAQNIGMTVFPEGGTKRWIKLADQQMPVPAIESNLKFFEALKTVQTAYQVRFDRPGDYTADDYNHAIMAATFANGQRYKQQCADEFSITFFKGWARQEGRKLQGNSLKAAARVRDEVMIYGQNILLGYKNLEVENLVVINQDELERGETDVVRVRPASNQLSIYYTPEPEHLAGALPISAE